MKLAKTLTFPCSGESTESTQDCQSITSTLQCQLDLHDIVSYMVALCLKSLCHALVFQAEILSSFDSLQALNIHSLIPMKIVMEKLQRFK